MERQPQEKKTENFEREQRTEKIYQAALSEHPQFKEFPESELREVIKSALREIDDLEKAADPKAALSALTPEIAKNLSALWVFSGAGTYDRAIKDDRYQTYPWAKWMDHNRLSYAAWLARKVAEIKSGIEPSRGEIDDASARKSAAKENIGRYGPTIIYNGTEAENAVVRAVPKREGVIVPGERVIVEGEGIYNTADQIKTFVFPEELRQTGTEIGLISHAPHLMHILHMLKRYPSVPKEMTVRLFPIAAPAEGREEYETLEIKGFLYYIYLSPNRDALKETYPHIIHGKQEK